MNCAAASTQHSALSRVAHAACRCVLFALALGVPVAALAAEADGKVPSKAAVSDAIPAEGVTPKMAAGAERRSEGRLVIFNRPIFTFRSDFLGVPPAERAAGARHRIITTLERGGEGRVSVENAELGAVIKVDGRLAFFIANVDVEAVGADTLEGVTEAAVRALEQAIAATKEARDARSFTSAAIWAGGATVIYLCALWILRFVGRAVTGRMLRLAESTAGQLRIGGTEIVRSEGLLRFVNFALRVGFWAIALLLTYQWIGYILGRFPFTRPWGDGLNTFLVETVVDMLTAVARAVPDLLIVVVIFMIARIVNGLLHNFFDGVQERRVHVDWIDADSVRPTRRLVSIGVWIFALVMAYPYIPGSDSEAFKGLSVLIGLMVSIGGSGLVGQAASGLILMYTRTYRPGEYVRIAEHEGTIVEMGMFTTRVRTGLGEELTLPNSLVLGAVTKNYSRVVRGEGFVLDSTITIGYDAPWRQVHAMLIEAARRTEGVLSVPAPHVFQTVLSDFYVEYRVVCQGLPSDPRPRAQLVSDLHGNIQDVFNEHGVQIMSPHYLGDPAQNKVVPKDRWYAAPAKPPK